MAPVRWWQVALLVPGFMTFGFLRGQTAGSPANKAAPQNGTKIQVTTQEVLVDAVVRDKHQKLIRGLEAGDFEVLEDGVPQQIKMFRFVGGKEAATGEERPSAPGAATGAAAQQGRGLDPLRQIQLISLVVMPVRTQARISFRNAARSLVEEGLQANTYMGVFLVDSDFGARVMQSFTNDRAALLAAIDRLASVPGRPEYTGDIDDLLNQRQPYVVPLFTNTNGPGANPYPSIDLQRQDMLGETAAQREMIGLLHVAKFLAELPGRKTAVLFSDGIPMTAGVTDLFRSVISTANRGQVTFYAFDLGGSGIGPALAQSRVLLLEAAEESAKMQTDPNYTGVGGMDAALASFHAYAPWNLEELAEATGGFKVMARGATGEALRRIT
jgi:VWFA-related protein